jgi:L-lysine 2,3-aminomutase
LNQNKAKPEAIFIGGFMEAEFENAKREYIKAKLIYEAKLKEVKEANKPIHQLLEQGKITEEEWAELTTENDFKLGLYKAMQELIEAEDKLIKIGKQVLEKHITPEQAEQIKQVWDCKFAHIKQKIIDVLLRIQP